MWKNSERKSVISGDCRMNMHGTAVLSEIENTGSFPSLFFGQELGYGVFCDRPASVFLCNVVCHT